jgi:hypothetical protein
VWPCPLSRTSLFVRVSPASVQQLSSGSRSAYASTTLRWRTSSPIACTFSSPARPGAGPHGPANGLAGGAALAVQVIPDGGLGNAVRPGDLGIGLPLCLRTARVTRSSEVSLGPAMGFSLAIGEGWPGCEADSPRSTRISWGARKSLRPQTRRTGLIGAVSRAFTARLRASADVSFLKELVKRKRLPSGWLRSGSAGRTPLFPGVRWARGFLRSYRHLVLRLRVGCRRFATGSCNRSFRGDCSQHIPSRGTAHDSREQLRRGRGSCRRGLVSCEFLAVRATPTNASCC